MSLLRSEENLRSQNLARKTRSWWFVTQIEFELFKSICAIGEICGYQPLTHLIVAQRFEWFDATRALRSESSGTQLILTLMKRFRPQITPIAQTQDLQLQAIG